MADIYMLRFYDEEDLERPTAHKTLEAAKKAAKERYESIRDEDDPGEKVKLTWSRVTPWSWNAESNVGPLSSIYKAEEANG